jgi:SpoVK/Ycf46/Vps4 family AAA+-type ATPase
LSAPAAAAKTLVCDASSHFAAGTGVEGMLHGEHGGKPVMAILMGPPGSGKSTFAEAVMAGSAAARPWVRVCQVGPLQLSALPFINLLGGTKHLLSVSLY